MTLKTLTEEEDSCLMLEFRQTYWDEWTKFCESQGHSTEVLG